VGSLALGLAVNIVAFSVIHTLVFGDLPGIADRAGITRLSLQYEGVFGAEAVAGNIVAAGPLDVDDFDVLRRDLPNTLQSVAAENRLRLPVAVDGVSTPVTAAAVSDDYFATLRTTAQVGRLLTRLDNVFDAEPSAVISDHLWRRRFGASTDVVGQAVTIGGRAFSVVGVAPPQFSGIQPLDVGQTPDSGIQVWFGASLLPDVPRRQLQVFGRLAPGAVTADLEQTLVPVAGRIEANRPGERRHAAFVARSFGLNPAERPGTAIGGILLFMAIPLCVLGIAVANVLNLQLARAGARIRSITVRMALGASGRQAMRGLTYETVLLTMVATIAGLLLARATMQLAAGLLPFPLELNPAVVMVSVGLAALAMMGSTWLPARLTTRHVTLTPAASAPLAHSRFRSGLVVVQVALSAMFVLVAGLCIRSVDAVRQNGPAASDRIHFTRLTFPADVSPATRAAAINSMVDRLASADAFEAVGYSADGPLGGPLRYWLPADDPAIRRMVVGGRASAGWLDALGTQLITGRLFRADEQDAALVSEAMALRLATSPSGALGAQLRVRDEQGPEAVVRVVGVYRDAIRAVTGEPRASIYLPASDVTEATTLIVRARPGVTSWPVLQTATQSLTVDVTLSPLSNLEGFVAAQTADGGLLATVFSVLGGVATTFAALGLIAVMTFFVQLRSRELAIRSALGARPRDLVAMVVGRSTWLLGLGAMAGLALGVAMGTAMRSQLAGLSPFDGPTLLGTIALFIAVGAIAVAWPARQASRAEPASLLRQS
jgi:predicted permease